VIEIQSQIYKLSLLGRYCFVGGWGSYFVVDINTLDILFDYKLKNKQQVTKTILTINSNSFWISQDNKISVFSFKSFVPNCFKIIVPGREYLISAPNERDMEDWVEAIELARVCIDK
jgi:hypothetical protein